MYAFPLNRSSATSEKFENDETNMRRKQGREAKKCTAPPVIIHRAVDKWRDGESETVEDVEEKDERERM